MPTSSLSVKRLMQEDHHESLAPCDQYSKFSESIGNRMSPFLKTKWKARVLFLLSLF